MRRTAVAIALLLAFSGTLSAQAPAAPKPGPEHQQLAAFVGNWTFSGEMKPGPMGPGGKLAGTDRLQWLPGNFFVERRFEGTGPMGKISGVEILGYDSAKKTHTFSYFDSIGSQSSGTIAVKGNTWMFTGTGSMGGKTMQERCNLTFADPSTLKIACEASGDGKSWMPMMEGTATKAK